MPEINLSNKEISNTNSFGPGAELFALMLFHNDEKKRARFVMHIMMNVSIASETAITLTMGNIQAILNAQGAHELAEDAYKTGKKGLVAGALLKFLHDMAMSAVPEPSIKKAIFLYQSMFEGSNISLPLSEQTIRDCWTEFKPVAHLWAAQHNNQLNPQLAEEQKPWVVLDVLDFLTAAGVYQEFGCRFVPKRTRHAEPILNRLECWCVPDWIARNASFENAGPNQWILETLEKYKAPIKIRRV